MPLWSQRTLSPCPHGGDPMANTIPVTLEMSPWRTPPHRPILYRRPPCLVPLPLRPRELCGLGLPMGPHLAPSASHMETLSMRPLPFRPCGGGHLEVLTPEATQTPAPTASPRLPRQPLRPPGPVPAATESLLGGTSASGASRLRPPAGAAPPPPAPPRCAPLPGMGGAPPYLPSAPSTHCPPRGGIGAAAASTPGDPMLLLERHVGTSDGYPRYQVGVLLAHAGC